MRGGQITGPSTSSAGTKLSKSFLKGRAQSMQQKLADIAAAVGNIQGNVNSVKNSVGITNAPANNTVVAAAAATKSKRDKNSKSSGATGSSGVSVYKPSESKPSESKPSVSKPSESKPSVSKPSESSQIITTTTITSGPFAGLVSQSLSYPSGAFTPTPLMDQENRDFKQYLFTIKTLINNSSNAKSYKDTEAILNKINVLLSKPSSTVIDARDFIKSTVPMLQNINIVTPIPASIIPWISSSGGRRSRKVSKKARKASRKNRKASRRSRRASRSRKN